MMSSPGVSHVHAVRLQETFYIERAWSTILEHYEPIGEHPDARTA